jgi:outer membrane protein OmpA-like peptidoglycan-associated protein
LWSRYRREQRMPSIDAATMPIKAYGNYLMNYHNAKLGVGFNFMEFWPRRQAQWLNIWVGTGAGYMMAKGNEYGIYFNTTITENGTSKPATGDINIDNNSSVSIQGNVRTTNEHSSFNKLYIPLSLHMEFDVTRRLTIGVKGEMDFVMKREDIAPKNLLFGMATVRYNIVPSRAQKMQAYYDASIDDLNNRVNELQKQADAAHARAEKAETDLQRLAQENAGLQRQLSDCEQSKVVVEKPTYTVQFDHNSSYFNKEQGEALKAFARQHQGKKLSLLAESSSPGSEEYNQELSERRLMRVIQALQAEGFTAEQLKPCVAIGAQRGIDSAEARRVTITVE